jgi:outer membrane murein-binding lipoprotein Lpp
MKIKMIVCSALAASLLAGCVSEKGGEAKEAKLMAEAKVSKETAQASALAKVPGGTVKDGELEKEKGKLIWSFDITTPDSKDIKEVAVDAMTGDVIAVDTETPADQAKEAAEDAAKAKKKGGDKEDKD